MHRSAPFLALLLIAGAFAATAAVATAAEPPAGRYIVVLKDGVSRPGAVAAEHARAHGASVRFVYRHALRGYAATIPDARVAAVRDDARVAYVERDGVAHAIGKPPKNGGSSTGQTLPWGIDRIDGTRAYGALSFGGVNAYVIDTGIDAGHADLNVLGNVNFAGGPNTDCNGHGTHVAGTVAAEDNTQDVVGVTPNAPLTGVKVLSCSGSGSYSGVIAGVDWVTANAVRPAVANMSLGGPAHQALDDAVRESAASGIVYSIAAGNDGEDACGQSPARAGTTDGVITTGATDSADAETSWSNFGACVDIWAPGKGILSTKKGGGTTTMSGTSMAAPHVGGTAALYLNGLAAPFPSAADVELQLESDAATYNTRTSKGNLIVWAGQY